MPRVLTGDRRSGGDAKSAESLIAIAILERKGRLKAPFFRVA